MRDVQPIWVAFGGRRFFIAGDAERVRGTESWKAEVGVQASADVWELDSRRSAKAWTPTHGDGVLETMKKAELR
jgi:hypothetical protein